MSKFENQSKDDTKLITFAIASVFRQLSRLLLGRIPLNKLQDLLRDIFVEEAENTIRSQRADKNISLSQLALLTGLDTRTLTRIIKTKDQKIEPESSGQSFDGLSLECALVERWTIDPQYVDPRTGEPRSLIVGDKGQGFERLFRETISTRGITANSVVKRLVATRTAILDKDNRKIKLISKEFSPFLSDDEASRLIAGFHAIMNLASTVHHNINCIKNDRNFQRESWTYRLSQDNQQEFRRLITDFLANVDNQAKEAMRPFEETDSLESQLSAGVGLYSYIVKAE